ncbi:MAG: hypothetical protein QOH24_2230, partial [Verrucomicrobiota bacterium]
SLSRLNREPLDRVASPVEITRKLRRCNCWQKDGGSDPHKVALAPNAARRDDGAATLDRSAAQDGKRGPCQPTRAMFRTNTGSEQIHEVGIGVPTNG